MFLSRKKKNNVYPCKPQVYYIKVRFKGVKIIKACFRDVEIGDPVCVFLREPKRQSFHLAWDCHLGSKLIRG